MLAVALNGGLGNQLFQLAAAETIASETGRTFCVTDTISPITVHTDRNYFSSVLADWATRPRLPPAEMNAEETSFEKQEWSTLPQVKSICLHGYFQNWRYVPSGFVERLRLPECPPLNGAFIHIRGGDYVNNPFHDVGLHKGYYRRALTYFPPGTHFYVFTNDIAYAKRFSFLLEVPHTFVDADEVNSLAQMGACILGGICANSSFSWWGAYLNPNRTIVMPDKWFNDPKLYTDGYYFPGVRKCMVLI